jgi:crossover junction endodeoxyribonuclease RusA
MSQEVKLVLPYPPSANRAWRTYMPKGFKAPVTVVSAEGKSYKEQVALMLKAAGIKSPIAGRVEIDIKLYPKRPQDWAKRAAKNPNCWDDDVQCLDLDNVNKVLFDALKGIAIEDDKWVRRLTSERMEPDGEARVVLVIRQMQAVGPQASLI